MTRLSAALLALALLVTSGALAGDEPASPPAKKKEAPKAPAEKKEPEKKDENLIDGMPESFIGPLLALFLLAFYRPGLHPKAVLFAALGGMAFLLLFLNIPVLPEGMWKPPFHDMVSWPWNPFISMTATVVLAHGLSPVFGEKKERAGRV